MNPHLSPALQLLHAASSGVLATHSVEVLGYPFATVLPFVLDELHQPVFLISGLAEHTKNLLADGRASFLVTAGEGSRVLREARLTLVGDAAPCTLSEAMLARYLRYQPDARRYLQLADFRFFRLVPQRARYIAGFGAMGWIESGELQQQAALPLSAEAACLTGAENTLPGDMRLLGIDCYGMDVERQGQRARLPFDDAPLAPGTILAAVAASLARL